MHWRPRKDSEAFANENSIKNQQKNGDPGWVLKHFLIRIQLESPLEN